MGVDLALAPLYLDNGAPFPTNWLCLDRERELWAHIEASKIEQPLGCEMYHYEDEGLERTKVTPYGTPITWARARDLAELLIEWENREGPAQPFTRAATRYLDALPDDTRVVLWWH